MTAMRCAKCGKQLPWLPSGLEGKVKVRCRACFGAAPPEGASPVADLFDRSYERYLAVKTKDRWSEAA
jgi:hypothetical protein